MSSDISNINSSKAPTVTIVGGGPVGCYAGHLLARQQIDTTIIEDNITIGQPEQCTGIFNVNLDEFVKPKREHILNTVKGAAFCCGTKQVDIKAKEDKAYVYDRIKFDQYIADLAVRSGAAVRTKTRFLQHEEHQGKLRLLLSSPGTVSSSATPNSVVANTTSKTDVHETDILIGADGPNSAVAKSAGLFGNRKFWIGNQVFLETKKPWFDKELAYLFFDKKYHEDFFAWVVPMSETTAKVGTASYKNANAYLNSFLADKFPKAHVTGRQGGLIPYYNNEFPCQKNKNIFLVGDAAFHVKATTGGGVVNGFWAARELSESILQQTYDYEERVKKVKRNLWLHLMMREKCNRFSDTDYEELISALAKPSIQGLLQKYGDNDYPYRFLFRLLVRAPGLMKYVVK